MVSKIATVAVAVAIATLANLLAIYLSNNVRAVRNIVS